jgi:hypothetical protein
MSNVRPHSMSRMQPPLSMVLLLVVAVMACGGGGDEPPPPGAGPCYHSFGEPSLIISSAQNSVTAAPVSVLTLSNVTLDGTPFDATFLPTEALNVRVTGSSLECTVPCGFATHVGAISFTASAPGFTSRPVAANGAYSSFIGGCPSSETGGNRIAVLLSPQ